MKYLIREINPKCALQPGSRAYEMGPCFIMVSPPYGELGWHMSISCANRNPRWDEIKFAWYKLVPESDKRHGAMFFPPVDEYVNLHEYCFHIHEVSENCKNFMGEK